MDCREDLIQVRARNLAKRKRRAGGALRQTQQCERGDLVCARCTCPLTLGQARASSNIRTWARRTLSVMVGNAVKIRTTLNSADEVERRGGTTRMTESFSEELASMAHAGSREGKRKAITSVSLCWAVSSPIGRAGLLRLFAVRGCTRSLWSLEDFSTPLPSHSYDPEAVGMAHKRCKILRSP